jgi:hypothetical protein
VARELVWVKVERFHGWACSACAWQFKSSWPLIGNTLEEMKRNYERQRDEEFNATPKATCQIVNLSVFLTASVDDAMSPLLDKLHLNSLAEANRLRSEAFATIANFVVTEIESGLMLCRIAKGKAESDSRDRSLELARKAYTTAENGMWKLKTSHPDFDPIIAPLEYSNLSCGTPQGNVSGMNPCAKKRSWRPMKAAKA